MQLFELVFSPTGGTRRVADLLAGELPGAALRVDGIHAMLCRTADGRKENELFL